MKQLKERHKETSLGTLKERFKVNSLGNNKMTV